MARSMLPYRRERKLVSQPPTPDGSMAVIKVNLVTSAAFHNDGRARGSSKVTSHSKWVDTGLHCPWHRFPHTSANHDNSPAASTEVSAGDMWSITDSINKSVWAAWSIQRPGCTGLAVGATPLAHMRARLASPPTSPSCRYSSATGNEGRFCPNLRCRSRLGGLLLAAPTNVWPGLFSVRRDTGFVAA